jgi:hypothetical protein
MGLSSFKIEIETRQIHVGGLGDFDVAFGAVHYVDFMAETFDETGFVGSVHTIGSGFGKSVFQ